MSPERKAMKVISLLFIVWGLIALIYTLLTIIESSSLGWNAEGILVSVIACLQAILGFLVSGTGIKGSTTPSKAASFNASALVLTVFEVCFLFIGGVLAFVMQQASFWVDSWGVGISVAGAVLAVCGFYFGNKVYKASLK